MANPIVAGLLTFLLAFGTLSYPEEFKIIEDISIALHRFNLI